jgi:thiopeptide-type bacteriocin biosynthesis protein
MMPEKLWLETHLYYSEPWENFLSQAVAPFVEQMMQHNLAEHFFFIRYWEKGPHIRLHLKGNPQKLETYVKPALLKHFTAYFQAYPSARAEPAWLNQLPGPQRWLPNNSIRFVAYEPETGRYGGEQGIPVAEVQFQVSSAAVLAILQQRGNWDYSQALGAAIRLHLGFAFAAGMHLAEAVCFFSTVFENWLSRACFSYKQPVTDEELHIRQKEVLQAFSRTYQLQKPVLLPLFRHLWTVLQKQQAFEQHWFNEWLQQMQSVHKALQGLQARGQILTPPGYVIHPHEQFSTEQQQRWAVYDSYLHMTNNRLGILNHDEGFLGYLIKQGLEEMASENKHFFSNPLPDT